MGQRVADSLQDGAGQRAAIVAQAQPDERPPCIGVSVGSSLAGEVGREQQALDTGLPACSLLEQRGEAALAAEHIVQPAQRASGREHHPHHVPDRRDGVAERVQRAVGGVALTCGKHDPARPEHHRRRPLLIDHPDAERPRRLVARAGGDRYA